jgi:hypothetical protein
MPLYRSIFAKHRHLIEINQLAFSATRWQHRCQKSFQKKIKNHKINDNSTTTKGREEPSTELESLEFYKKIDVCLTKFKKL